jgi:hypothetical protein
LVAGVAAAVRDELARMVVEMDVWMSYCTQFSQHNTTMQWTNLHTAEATF